MLVCNPRRTEHVITAAVTEYLARDLYRLVLRRLPAFQLLNGFQEVLIAAIRQTQPVPRWSASAGQPCRIFYGPAILATQTQPVKTRGPRGGGSQRANAASGQASLRAFRLHLKRVTAEEGSGHTERGTDNMSSGHHLACCQKALLLSLPDDCRPDVIDLLPPSLRRLATDVMDPLRR